MSPREPNFRYRHLTTTHFLKFVILIGLYYLEVEPSPKSKRCTAQLARLRQMISLNTMFRHRVVKPFFFSYKEKAEVKSLSLKTGSPIRAPRCPRTIAEDEHSIADLYRHHSEDRFYKSMGGGDDVKDL